MKNLLTGDNLIKGNSVLGREVIKELQKESSKYGSYEALKHSSMIENGDVIVAGASVATAIFKLLNIQGMNLKYNDVDIFINGASKIGKIGLSKIKLERKDKVITANVTDFNVGLGEYSEIVLTRITRYQVIRSTRENLINKVYVKYASYLGSCVKANPSIKVKELVSGFDFNAVQVGVDLASGELYGTPEFWTFVATKQVSIQNLNTPSHTLIRYFKKKEEMGDGIYFDDDFIVTACLLGINQIREKGYEIDFPMNFGLETLKKAEPYLDQLSEYVYLLKEETLLNSYQTYAFKLKSNILDNIYTKLDLDISTANFFNNMPVTEIIDVLDLYKRGRKSDKNFFNLIVSDKYRFGEVREYRYLHGLLFQYPKFFMKQKHKDEGTLQQVNKLLEHNISHHIFNIGLDGAKKFISDIKPIVDQYGNSIYGKLEKTIKIPKDIQEFKKDLEKEEILKIKPLIEYSFNEMQIGEYKVRELVTPKELEDEGNYMKHCVGGYSNEVKCNNAKILSFYHKDKTKRMTVELALNEEKTEDDKFSYVIIQIKHYRNEIPTEELKKFVYDSIPMLSKVPAVVSNRFYKKAPVMDLEDEIPF